jgi:hypothetical protein
MKFILIVKTPTYFGIGLPSTGSYRQSLINPARSSMYFTTRTAMIKMLKRILINFSCNLEFLCNLEFKLSGHSIRTN